MNIGGMGIGMGRENIENVERVTVSGGIKSKCPLTEIVNYVNRRK